MADNADIAGDYIIRRNQEALENRVRYQGESRTHCLICEEEIPQRRREAVPGVTRCVECQAADELRMCR